MSTESNQIDTVGAVFSFELRDVPMEVTDYAFDQFADRLTDPTNDELSTILEESHFAYESQIALFATGVIPEVLESAALEKLNDMELEIERGVRDDYTKADIRRFRKIVSEELSQH